MKLTKAQVTLFWRLWGQACSIQKWLPEHGVTRQEQESRRKLLLADCGFCSLTLVDRTAGFGRVKAALLTLCDSIDGAIESDRPDMDEARRYRHVLTWDVLPKLARLPQMAQNPAGAIGYAEAICRAKFRLGAGWVFDLDDLDAGQLKQLLVTLTARLRGKQSSPPASPAEKSF